MKIPPFHLILLLFLGSCIYSHTPEDNATKSDTTFDFSYSAPDEEQNAFPEDSFRTERRKIGLGKARTTSLDISIPAGILAVKGGTSDLAEVAIKYRKERRFLIKQDLTGDHLYAKLYMPKIEGLKEINDDRTVCSIRLNEKVPMDLSLSLGAGKGKFELGNLNLKSISMSLGAGEFNVNLKSTNASTLKVNAGVGEATIDLSGKRKDELDAEFNCGIGTLKLILPQSAGIRVSLSGLIGNIDMNGLVKKGGYYYNDAWETRAPRMRIDINGGIGDVKILMTE